MCVCVIHTAMYGEWLIWYVLTYIHDMHIYVYIYEIGIKIIKILSHSMSIMASQITGHMIVCSTVYTG